MAMKMMWSSVIMWSMIVTHRPARLPGWRNVTSDNRCHQVQMKSFAPLPLTRQGNTCQFPSVWMITETKQTRENFFTSQLGTARANGEEDHLFENKTLSSTFYVALVGAKKNTLNMWSRFEAEGRMCEHPCKIARRRRASTYVCLTFCNRPLYVCCVLHHCPQARVRQWSREGTQCRDEGCVQYSIFQRAIPWASCIIFQDSNTDRHTLMWLLTCWRKDSGLIMVVFFPLSATFGVVLLASSFVWWCSLLFVWWCCFPSFFWVALPSSSSFRVCCRSPFLLDRAARRRCLGQHQLPTLSQRAEGYLLLSVETNTQGNDCCCYSVGSRQWRRVEWTGESTKTRSLWTQCICLQSRGGSHKYSWRSIHTAWINERLFNLATRRSTPRALGIINVQHRRHVWVHVPGSSAFLQRHQKIFNKLIWMFPEVQHRGCEVHVDDKAVVSKFERAVEHCKYICQTNSRLMHALGGWEIITVWWWDKRVSCCLVHTLFAVRSTSSRQCDWRHAHSPFVQCCSVSWKLVQGKCQRTHEYSVIMRTPPKIVRELMARAKLILTWDVARKFLDQLLLLLKFFVWRFWRQWLWSSQLNNVKTLTIGSGNCARR